MKNKIAMICSSRSGYHEYYLDQMGNPIEVDNKPTKIVSVPSKKTVRVYFKDHTHCEERCSENDEFDVKVAVALAIAHHIFDYNKTQYNKYINGITQTIEIVKKPKSELDPIKVEPETICIDQRSDHKATIYLDEPVLVPDYKPISDSKINESRTIHFFSGKSFVFKDIITPEDYLVFAKNYNIKNKEMFRAGHIAQNTLDKFLKKKKISDKQIKKIADTLYDICKERNEIVLKLQGNSLHRAREELGFGVNEVEQITNVPASKIYNYEKKDSWNKNYIEYADKLGDMYERKFGK